MISRVRRKVAARQDSEQPGEFGKTRTDSERNVSEFLMPVVLEVNCD
jgi:hypothetical protein